MVYLRKKKNVSIAEIWYQGDTSQLPKVDIYRYKFSSELAKGAYSVEELATLEIDLSQNEDSIWANIAKNTRYEIHRAKERDPVKVETFLERGEKDKQKIEQYISFFNEFAQSKDRSFIEYPDLAPFFESGTLVIRSCTDTETDEVIVMHAYIVSDNRARLFQSSSHFRNIDDAEYRKMSGRANRFLHWDDILFFKKGELLIYDFGGWYKGNSDLEKISINRFKESFGGTMRLEYSYIKPGSLLGKISILGRFLLKRK